MSVNSGLVNKD